MQPRSLSQPATRLRGLGDFQVRSLYVFQGGAEEARRFWPLLIETFLNDLVFVEIDAYPSPEWPSFKQLPEEVQEAQGQLARLGREQNLSARDPLMAVRLQLDNPENLHIVKMFGPFSIRAEVFIELEDSTDSFAGVSDSGTSAWVHLSEDEHRRLVEAIRIERLPLEGLLPKVEQAHGRLTGRRGRYR
jgi:hypothetical protein